MDVAGFDLNLLKAFDALYAERHVTRAGQRIGLSQSAMSGALTRLREVCDDELFVRSPKGMQPTPRASLPQFLVAPFVVANTDLIATLASRVARRLAAVRGGNFGHRRA